MAAKRKATAVWEHDLAKGQGHVSADTGAFRNLPVTWAARTEAPGGKTSPEELLAAAHAACYAMAFSATLGRMGKPPELLTVNATATFDKVDAGWRVTTIELDVTGKVSGLDTVGFADAAREAEKGCPISNAVRNNVEIHVSARLA